MRELKVKNSEWFRGTAGLLGQIQEGEACFCIIGLDARDRGIEEEDLIGVGALEDLPGPLFHDILAGEFDKIYDDWLFLEEDSVDIYSSTPDCMEVIRINDREDQHLTSEGRLDEMRPYFEKKDIELVWCPHE